jgi:putative copper export protein
MPLRMTFWNAVLWLHLLAMAFFVGGQLMLAGVLVPLLRGPEAREQLRAAARRFGIGSLIAIAVLLATGAGMASHLHLWSDSTLHIKLALVVLVGVLVLVHMRKPALHAIDGAIFLATLAIVWCGVVIAS